MTNGCSVATPTLIYAWTTQDAFDLIALPATTHDWQHSRTLDLINNDGRTWERRCHSKSIEKDGVRVVFQFFEERPVQIAPDTSNAEN